MNIDRIHRLARNAAILVLMVALSGCGDDRDQSVTQAKADLAAGNAKAAIVRLRSVLQSHPDFADGRLLLGQALLESGDAWAAPKELRKAFEAGGDADTVKPLLARALLENGDYKAVLSDFSPQQTGSLEARADILASQAYAYIADGKLEAAKGAVRQAFEASAEPVRAVIAQAVIAGVQGDYEAASVAIDKILASHPKSADALRAKATIAQAKGDQSAAIQAMQTLTQLRPVDAVAHYKLTMMFWQAGRIDEVKAEVGKMKTLVGDHPGTAYVEALIAAKEKDMVVARDHVMRVLKADPDFSPALLLSGIVNSELGEYEIAERSLEKLLARERGNLAAQQVLVGVLLKTHRAERAMAVAQEALARSPTQPAALMLAASVYLKAGDATTAQALFEKANAGGKSDAKALTGLALARMAAGNEGKAVDALMQASAADELAIEADFLLVNHFLASKQFDKALEGVATMASKRPGDARILILEGEVLAGAGRTAEARSAFEKAYELRPDLLVSLRELGRLDLADNHADRAKRRFDEAIARRPADAQLLVVYSEWLRDSKAEPEAIRAPLERAVEVAPSDASVRISLASFHASRNDFARALAVVEEAAKAIPGNKALLSVLADLQLRAGKPDLAVASLAKAIEAAPAAPDLLVRLADLQLVTGAFDAAILSLRKALSLQPSFRPATVRLIALEQMPGRPSDVIEAARQIQQSQPNDAIGYLLEGRLFIGQGRSAEAIRVLRLGVERSSSPQVVVALHSALLKAGKADEAAKAASDWLRLHPKDPVVRIALADNALAARDYPVAIRLYKDVLADFPDSVRLLNNLAWAAARVGDPAARDYAERAHRLAPNDPNVLDTLGWMLVERGDVARGTELLRRASLAAPNVPHLRLNLAKALIRSGDIAGARRELDVLAKLGDKYPAQAEVKRLLAGL